MSTKLRKKCVFTAILVLALLLIPSRTAKASEKPNGGEGKQSLSANSVPPIDSLISSVPPEVAGASASKLSSSESARPTGGGESARLKNGVGNSSLRRRRAALAARRQDPGDDVLLTVGAGGSGGNHTWGECFKECVLSSPDAIPGSRYVCGSACSNCAAGNAAGCTGCAICAGAGVFAVEFCAVNCCILTGGC
jgi:hypothetical protein